MQDLLEFDCERCGASLKVRPVLAGKSVQCPKCHRKTAIPSRAEDGPKVATPAPPPAAPTPNMPPSEKPPVDEALDDVATPPPAPAPEQAPVPSKAFAPPPAPPPEIAPAASAKMPAKPQASPAPAVPQPPPKPDQPPEPSQTERVFQDKIESLNAQLAEAVKTANETAAENARLRKASDDRKAVASQDSRLASELSAARNRIRELEAKLATIREQLKQAREALAEGKALPAEAVTFDETEEADAMLAGLRPIAFGKVLRTAVLAHIVVILVTSMGYLYRQMQNRRPAAVDPSITAMPTGQQIAAPPPDRDVSPFEDDLAVPTAPTPEERQPPRQEEPARPLSDVERRIQELPAPDERPTSDVSLDF